MNYLGIKNKILILVLAVIIIISMILSYFTFSSFEKHLLAVIEESLITKAIQTSTEVSFILTSKLDVLEALALSSPMQSMDLSNVSDILKQFGKPLYDDIIVANMQGTDIAKNKPVYVGEQAFFKSAIKGNAYIGGIEKDPLQEDYYIIIATPIKKNAQIIGVIAARIHSNELSQVINDHNLVYDNYAYILDDKGIPVAHKEYKHVERNISAQDIDDGSGQFDGLAAFYKESLTNEIGYGGYYRNTQKMIVSYNTVKGTNWRVYVAASEKRVIGHLQETRNMYYVLTVIILIISLLSSRLIASRIADPLIELSEKFNEASRGNLSVRSNYNKKDEIGDVSESFNMLMNQINKLTFYDSLTHLPNSNILIQNINNRHQSGKEDHDTLILISIDKFTKINEIYGILTGDKILITISERLNKIIKKNGSLYKGRGDEFFILLKGINQEVSELNAQKVSTSLLSPYFIEGIPILIKCSMGLVNYNIKDFSASQLINNVTHANVLSKGDPTNRWRWYSKNTHQMDKDRADLEIKLFSAIKDNEFYLVYQPIFALSDEKVAEAEVLIRWHNKTLGLVSTEKFIKIAEESSFIKQIDEWVFKEACKQVIKWENQIPLSVNISASTFEDDYFIDFISGMIKEYNIKPNCIQIELTERLILSSPKASISKMKALNELGIRIALDDFGVGYSSLNYLVTLPINLVKIDRSFTQKVGSDIQSTAIVNAIINMCHEIGLSVVAEGVENASEVNYLKARSCAFVQGYYYSKPIDSDSFEKQYIHLDKI